MNTTRPPVRECRSCLARIVWCATTDGKMMPVDADGVFAAIESLEWWIGGGKVLPKFNADIGHVSHFATCPNAKEHRRK